MADYDLIKNTELRLLVTASESIRSLKEQEIQQWVERIAALPPEGERAMLVALRDEQEQIRKAKLAKGITPEMERAEREKKMEKVYAIKKDFEKVVRIENEKTANNESSAEAESLLKKL